jgi:hypothetical protein
MKIAVQCQSPLLQKSLEMFLSNYLCSIKQCDIIVRDEECLNDEKCFYISSDEDADLLKPFSRSQLILALEKRYKSMMGVPTTTQESKSLDFEILEQRINQLTQEYQANIIRTVKAFYEE